MDNPPGGCYLDAMRLVACLLLLLLAVPARALDDEDAADSDGAETGARLRAIDEAAARDADHPEGAGDEEPDDREALDDAEREPRDPYDDEDEKATAPAPRSRRDADRTPAAKPERYPNPLAPPAPTGGKPTDGKGAEQKRPSSLDADD